MRSILFTIVAIPAFLLLPCNLTAQNKKLLIERDILMQAVAKAPKDTGGANTHIKLLTNYWATYFYPTREDSIIYFQAATAAANLCKELNYLPGLAACYLLESKAYDVSKDMTLRNDRLQKAIDTYVAANDKAGLADAYQFKALLIPFADSLKKSQILDSALNMTKEARDVIREATILRDIADFHLNQRKFNLAIKELLSLLEFQKKTGDKRLHFTTDLLVPNFRSIGNRKEALRYAIATIDYCRKADDTTYIFTFYQRLAQIYFDLGDHDKSISYYKKALNSYTNGKWQPGSSLARQFVSNIVTSLLCQGKLDEASALLDNYLSPAPEGDWQTTEYLDAQYASLHFLKKDYKKSEKYILQRLGYRHRLPYNKEADGVLLSRAAEVYLALKQYEKATFYNDSAYKIGKEFNSMYLLMVASQVGYKLDSIKGNYLSAFRHFQEYKSFADAMQHDMLDKQLIEMSVQYETDQKNSELSFLNTQAKLHEEAIQQGNSLRNFMIAGSVLLLLLLLLIFNRYRVKQRANKLLQEKQDEINRQNQTLEKMVYDEKMITTEKDRLLQEKEWLMKEINHRVKNNLQVVMSLLNTQSAYLKDEAALNAIEESRHRVHAISLIHRKLYQSDQQLTRIDMAAYIKEVAEYLTESLDTQNRIELGLFIDPTELDVTQAVPIGLIINEAVTNAVKYAFSKSGKGQINVSMYKKVTGPIELTIQDNGIGLPPGFNWQQTDSLGMSLMQGLCSQLDGRFDIRQQNGLTIKITFEPAKVLNQ